MGAVSLAVLAAGCSADVARFDFPTFSLTDDDSSGAPVPPEPVGRAGPLAGPANAGGYVPPGHSNNQVQMSALPEPVAHPAPPPAYPSTASPINEPRRSTFARTEPSYPPESQRGEMIEVQRGDTLFGLARRHGVSVSELMSANGLSNHNLKLGQQLYLPGGRTAARKPVTRQVETVAIPVPPATLGKYSGTHTIRPGENLYGIAIQHRVTVAELQQVNGITDVRKVRPGTVIKVPAMAGETPAMAAAEPEEAMPRFGQPAIQPTIINGQRYAARNDTISDAGPRGTSESAGGTGEPQADRVAVPAPPAAASDGDKLRWPVIGRVIAGFGPRPDGTHNDGINISVPLGTDVLAAEGGVVAYAGNELKGYGNLILVRHDNGWVTAYAHNDDILVTRGDKVRRGQVIAKAGKTGTVDQPQVHFELRQGSKPVDPTPFLMRM